MTLAEVNTMNMDPMYDGFAREFFTHHKQRPDGPVSRSLQHLIVGFEMRLHSEYSGSAIGYYTPARCYRKSRSVDPSERERDRPDLISLSEFRAMSDHTDILDQFSEWVDDFCWMWRAPGRFHGPLKCW
jgi:hypothetical protein